MRQTRRLRGGITGGQELFGAGIKTFFVVNNNAYGARRKNSGVQKKGGFQHMTPKMTSKNLEEISELLDSEDLAYKKCLFYSVQASDPTLKAKLGGFANNHKRRFEALFSYLESHE
jgi:hypothetical protein